MSKRGIVQSPLTANEIFELGETVFQHMPRNLNPTKVRADLANKKVLGHDLGKFFRDRYAAAEIFAAAGAWINFYRRTFGREVDLANLYVPVKPEGAHRAIVVIPGITNNDCFMAMGKRFGTWRYYGDLNSACDIVKRSKGPYVVWVKDTVEADPDLANVSAEEIARRNLNTLTLRERLILELKFFDETSEHLDVDNITLCAGSRDADGRVPGVHWRTYNRKVCLDRYYVDDADSYVRARAAVST